MTGRFAGDATVCQAIYAVCVNLIMPGSRQAGRPERMAARSMSGLDSLMCKGNGRSED
jgi:hypothetical protein